MIRFACPGCSAVYTVDATKGGKTGKCPKCQSQFIIPFPEGGAAPAPEPPRLPTPAVNDSFPAPIPQPPVPPPPVNPTPISPPPLSPNSPVEIAPCPSCQSRLTVLPSDLGKDVECPSCRTIFAAVLPGQAVSAPLPPPAPPRISSYEDSGRRQRDDDDDDDDRARSKRRRREDDDEDEDRPKRRSRYNDDDDEEEDRPRKKKKRRRNIESKRVPAALFAILIGGFGIHKFYLGYTTAGIITILLSCVGVGGVIALVEGIIYLTKTDDEFIDTYQIGQKEWF
jgi:TM2 domain-containing membrane protein YozV